MKSRPEIIAISIILFVPFAYATFSVSDACAAAGNPRYYTSQNCSGDIRSNQGKTCCWREPIPGSILGQSVCQTCKETSDSKGTVTETCTAINPQAPSKPELSGPMEEGKLQEGDITAPDSDQKTGIFKVPETNNTFSHTDSSNTSNNTLAQLQSGVENDSAENNRDEADESEESGNSNEEEDE